MKRKTTKPRSRVQIIRTLSTEAPFFELDNYGTVYRNQADRAKIVQGLRKAGLN